MASTILLLAYNVAKYTFFAVGLVVAYVLSSFAYNLYLHPLRKYPGPIIHRATSYGLCRVLLSGAVPYTIRDLHRQYGPIVRIAPNELAFCEPDAWRDIHTRNKASNKYEFPQDDEWYNATNTKINAIIELPRDEHDRVRKLLANGFSERAIKAQEPVIMSYVDLLMRRLGERSFAEGEEKSKQTVDMRDFMAFTTFDVIGKLSFGTDFGCLEGSQYHPLIGLILASLKNLAVMHVLKMWHVLIPMMWLKKKLGGDGGPRQRLFEFIGALTTQRVELGTGRDDFMDGLIESGMPFKLLKKNATLLILAGSETTATLLTGTIYFLTAHPEVYEKLKQEVRAHFKTEADINITSVGNLSYMLAVLNETMRIYPPVAVGNPRRVPQEGGVVAGTHVPGGTIVSVWHMALYHSPDVFHDPMTFDPERFYKSDKNSVYANDRTDALQPFLLGPRNCVGQTLAYAEMRLILAKLIWNFDMTLDEGCKGWIKQENFLLWDKPPLNVYLQRVQR